ncbi:uncharacterized protein LOC103974128 isoform X2 [Musa acuminata AAA Group]|uniref:uncharacterized protein LOC103974128 isoform X2 n=1 Tax=Musa acuminata AAA Group TaxID=214697 RepID=UPI0031E3DDFB
MKFFSNQTFLGSSGMGGSPPATPPRRAIEEAHPLISPVPENPPARPRRTRAEEEQVRIRRRALENCRKALELLDVAKDAPLATARGEEGSPLRSDTDADELCTLLKSRVELSYFLEKLWSMQTSVHQNIHDDNASWDMVTARDLWEDRLVDGENDSEQDGFILIRQEDIVDGIACFMADYLLSLQQMKEFTPNQLQDALCKTFSVKKRSQLRKAWDGSKVIYNVASWSATAIEHLYS